MFTMDELLKGKKLVDQSPEIQANLLELLIKMNKVRAKRNKPMIVTSGLRTMEDHLRIYRELAAKRKVPFDPKKVPLLSKHLFGQAVDISDPDGSLFQWTKDNEKFLADVGLWLEEKDDQARVHFQIVPPKSGKRWFVP